MSESGKPKTARVGTAARWALEAAQAVATWEAKAFDSQPYAAETVEGMAMRVEESAGPLLGAGIDLLNAVDACGADAIPEAVRAAADKFRAALGWQ